LQQESIIITIYCTRIKITALLSKMSFEEVWALLLDHKGEFEKSELRGGGVEYGAIIITFF